MFVFVLKKHTFVVFLAYTHNSLRKRMNTLERFIDSLRRLHVSACNPAGLKGAASQRGKGRVGRRRRKRRKRWEAATGLVG